MSLIDDQSKALSSILKSAEKSKAEKRRKKGYGLGHRFGKAPSPSSVSQEASAALPSKVEENTDVVESIKRTTESTKPSLSTDSRSSAQTKITLKQELNREIFTLNKEHEATPKRDNVTLKSDHKGEPKGELKRESQSRSNAHQTRFGNLPLSQRAERYLLTSRRGREVLKEIYLMAEERGSNTIAITHRTVADRLGTKVDNVKKALSKIFALDLLTKIAQKTGNGGYQLIEIPLDVYRRIEEHIEFDSRQRVTQRVIEQVPERVIISPSSSSLTLQEIKTTSTKSYELPDEWLEIQTPQAVKDIGFGKSNLKQLFRVAVEDPHVDLTANDVQESLYAYEVDLEAGKVKANSKLALIMGVLRRGDKYVSEIQAEELRNFLERNKKRARELEQLQREEALAKLKEKAEIEFDRLSDEEKLNLVPENNIAKLGSNAHKHLVVTKLVNTMG